MKCSDVGALCKWLTLYVAETRKKDGNEYPPKTIYQLLTGLLCHMRALNPSCPNFLDTDNRAFTYLHTAIDNVFRGLRSSGVLDWLLKTVLYAFVPLLSLAGTASITFVQFGYCGVVILVTATFCCFFWPLEIYCTPHLIYCTLHLKYCTLHLRYCTVVLGEDVADL